MKSSMKSIPTQRDIYTPYFQNNHEYVGEQRATVQKEKIKEDSSPHWTHSKATSQKSKRDRKK